MGTTLELEGVDGHVVVIQVPVHKDAFWTILHESVHIWQKMMVYMQEDTPGIETEAYTIEHITKELWFLYNKLTDSNAIPIERKTRLQERKPAVQLPA